MEFEQSADAVSICMFADATCYLDEDPGRDLAEAQSSLPAASPDLDVNLQISHIIQHASRRSRSTTGPLMEAGTIRRSIVLAWNHKA